MLIPATLLSALCPRSSAIIGVNVELRINAYTISKLTELPGGKWNKLLK